MKRKHIIAAAIALSSLNGLALAGQKAWVAPVTAPVVAESGTCFTGKLTAGYITNYNWNGIILDDTTSGQNASPISLELNQCFNKNWFGFLNLDYTAIWNKDENAPALVRDWGIKGIDQNELRVRPGVAWHNDSGNLIIDGHYGLVHGGYMGLLNKWLPEDNYNYATGENTGSQLAQCFGVGVQYDHPLGEKNALFGKLTADYYFSELTGWWFGLTVGYRHSFTDKFAAVLENTWSFTSGYYEDFVDNGSQAVYLKLSLPYSFTKHVSFVPFVGTYWAGPALTDANRNYRDEVAAFGGTYGPSFRNFTWVAGANIVFNF